MASYLTDMDEIHCIIFKAPDSSDDSWQSSSEDLIQSQKMPKQHMAANKNRNLALQEHQDNGCQLKENVSDRFLYSKINRQRGVKLIFFEQSMTLCLFKNVWVYILLLKRKAVRS